MKKLWAIGLSAAVLLTGCGEEQSVESAEATTGSEDNKDVKKDMMRFYMTISNTINAVDAELNEFEKMKAEDLLPEGEELQAMKDAAIVSAKDSATAIETLEIPAVLENQKEQIETAFTAIRESYEIKAEELTKDASFEAADEKFTEADTLLNELLTEQGLAGSSIQNEVSQ